MKEKIAMINRENAPAAFCDMNLPAPIIKALSDAGYEAPTPIQAKTIPGIAAGGDVIGQAQTGTGKTAAFALPILSRIDLAQPVPQALVLTPTRELAIQVSEAFYRYAVHLRDFRVLPIYGGQEYGGQLSRLKRGVHVVVGTPGRVMDHMRRGSLKLGAVGCFVLDEADEMLRMGFIDDVEWILGRIPAKRQIALFSATMPGPVRKIARKHMQTPEQITIKAETMTVATTRQRSCVVGEHNKIDALTRILEVEPCNGVIVFVRTRNATLQVVEKLQARGYPCTAVNGDIVQSRREQIVGMMKDGRIDILVATDVAARGLDIDRISHVINYDVPSDSESYIHRIGRTGRAGRSGEAILFVTPREQRMLSVIEKATRQKMEKLELPSNDMINNTRVSRFKKEITGILAENDLDFCRDIIRDYHREHEDVTLTDIAAALVRLVQDKGLMRIPAGTKDMFVGKEQKKAPTFRKNEKDGRKTVRKKSGAVPETGAKTGHRGDMELFRLEVGHRHGIKPANIVGAIANETGLDAADIGRIQIGETFSTVDLPRGIPPEMFRHLKGVWVAGRQLGISRAGGKADAR